MADPTSDAPRRIPPATRRDAIARLHTVFDQEEASAIVRRIDDGARDMDHAAMARDRALAEGIPEQAGPELDHLVATEVLGWTARRRGGAGKYAVEEVYETPSGELHVRWHVTPSTNLDWAFQVVDHLAALTDPWMLTLQTMRYYERAWTTARFTTHALGPDPVGADGDTVPAAIARAAIMAIRATARLECDRCGHLSDATRTYAEVRNLEGTVHGCRPTPGVYRMVTAMTRRDRVAG